MADRLSRAWNRFWFEPVSTAPLGVFRIAYGLVALAWALILLPDAETFFGPDGVLPEQPPGDGRWGPLGLLDTPGAATAAVALLAAGAAALAAGWRTRAAAVVVFLCILMLGHRNPYVGNAGDALLRALAFFLVLAPAGAAFSLDRLREDRAGFWDSPRRAAWGVRLLQIQFSLIYLSTVWAKLRGDEWPGGTAVGTALRLEDLQRFDLPDIGSDEAIVNLATWGTLAVEASLGLLVWFGRLRPWVLLPGVLLHLAIHFSMRVGAFSLVILSLYLVWLSPEWIDRRLGSAGWRGRRASTPC